MQNTVTAERGASTPGLETRFAAVRAFMRDRGVRHYMSVFAAHGIDLRNREDDIRLMWNGRARLSPDDEELVSCMERVVELLKQAA